MLLDDLKWRYATKVYQEGKKVSQENIDKIVEAARLAPTSSGLQPFSGRSIKSSCGYNLFSCYCFCCLG